MSFNRWVSAAVGWSNLTRFGLAGDGGSGVDEVDIALEVLVRRLLVPLFVVLLVTSLVLLLTSLL